MSDVAVLIPTLRRPESLERALRSLFVQTAPMREIVVVDNDPQATAAEVVERLRRTAPCSIVLVHAPKPGVATARNAGLAATDAPLIAFLDDDEAADPRWLEALLRVQAATGADVTFSPIRGRAPDAAPWLQPYLETFFSRSGPSESGLIDRSYGCGASLMTRATALPGLASFDTRADQAGGEDDILFSALKARGGRFAWAADAWVEEFAPAHRATLRYALSRAFAYGQGPTQTAAAERNWPAVLRWTAIGAAQAAVWGLAAVATLLLRHPARAAMMDRAARGLGKIFWMKGLEPRFYGARELARLEAISPSAAAGTRAETSAAG